MYGAHTSKIYGNIDDPKRSHPSKIEILENLKETFFRVTFCAQNDGNLNLKTMPRFCISLTLYTDK